MTVSRVQALKWLAAPAQQHPRSSAKRPSDATAAPSSTKKPKTTAATTATPVRTTPIRETSLPLPAETAKLLPSRDGKWTSPLADAGGGGRTGSFEAIIDASVALPHTLLVGTQPATKSLANCWYFANDTNAFWHIVGHALRFRRGFHEQARPNGDVVPSIAKHLRGGELHLHEPRDEVCADYEEAVARLQGAGYALWDILSSSVRKSKKSGKQSSLDSDIRTPKAADIEGLVRRHPSIRRIVFVTGKGSADTFRKHFGEWLERAPFCCANKAALDVFGKGRAPVPAKGDARAAPGAIELVVPPSVSPAACADGHFGNKRDGWMSDVFDSVAPTV